MSMFVLEDITFTEAPTAPSVSDPADEFADHGPMAQVMEDALAALTKGATK